VLLVELVQLAADLVLLLVILAELAGEQHQQQLVVMPVVQELVDLAAALKLVVLDMLAAALAYMAKVLVEVLF
jgi:hypothetical protein